MARMLSPNLSFLLICILAAPLPVSCAIEMQKQGVNSSAPRVNPDALIVQDFREPRHRIREAAQND